MSISPPDFYKEPFKHPAVWKSHLVRRVLGHVGGASVYIATCECGFAASAAINSAGSASLAIAVDEHWRDVIAAAEAAPV
jgi:hypothetical protein